ncbi:hypothetical protein FKM82_000472 [Ascaphus truei]
MCVIYLYIYRPRHFLLVLLAWCYWNRNSLFEEMNQHSRDLKCKWKKKIYLQINISTLIQACLLCSVSATSFLQKAPYFHPSPSVDI